MPTIDSVHVAENLTAMWGINAYEYRVEKADPAVDPTGKVQVDFQDLMVAVSERRATAVEGEITPLTTRIRARNKELEILGSLLAKFTEAQSKFESNATGNSEVQVNGITANEIPLGQEAYDRMGGTGRRDGWDETSWWNSKWTKHAIEGMISMIKSMIDSRNNESQTDMSRLQSLVDRRDESYSTATNLMSEISDTRSNLIRNL